MSVVRNEAFHIDQDLTEGTDGNLYVLSESQKEDYVCSKCHQVPQTLFCLDEEIICEQCKLMLPQARKLDDFTQKRLQKLKIVCPNRVNGCSKGSKDPLPLSDLQDHRNACEYEPVSCEFHDLGCKETLPRVKMPGHVLTCKYRSNADVTRFFKETKAGQEELKQKGIILLSEVDLLRTKVKEQDETIKKLQLQVEKLLKVIPENNDPYWENASSRFNGMLHSDQVANDRYEFSYRYMGSLNTDEIDYTLDEFMFCKILVALKHNDKVKRVYLSIRYKDCISKKCIRIQV